MIKNYIIYRKHLFIFYFFAVSLMGIMEFLSGIMTSNIIYSVLVFSFLCIVVFLFDFFKFKKRKEMLDEVLYHLSYYEHDFPRADNLVTNQYNKIIHGLYEKIKENELNLVNKNAEKENYYTLWMHQIKTPISVIWLMLDNDEIDKKILEEEIFNIERYVEMALHYIKLEDLSNDLILEKLSLKSVINECIKKYANIFIYKKIKVEISGNDVNLISDRKWLSFVIEQILSNAVKYTAEGGNVKVEIEGGEYPLISVKDNGIGIKQEDIPRIFSKGYTGSMGRIDKKASGIGLFISKEICKTLGIDISINSKDKKGTEVSLRFPLNAKKIYE